MGSVDQVTLGEAGLAGSRWHPFHDAGNGDYREFCLEVPSEDEPSWEVTASWTEYLQWHEDYLTTRSDGLPDWDGWAVWHELAAPEVPFDDDAPWWLTDDAMESIAAVVRGRLPDWARSPGVLVKCDSGRGGDDPHFTVSVNLPGVTLESSEEECLALAWDVAATMQNLTDPGTFGVPYLFHEVRQDMGL